MQRIGLIATSAVLLLSFAGVGIAWRPALAQRTLATAREARVSGKTVGELLIRNQVAIRISTGTASTDAAERADVLATRLNRLDEDEPLRAADLRVSRSGSSAVLTARDANLITVTPDDARAAGLSVPETAQLWLDNLSDAL